ncbi:hypothetical protein MRB53_026255 [Persea americana]|uniref:Uncharacterized protein n=1 Tax=Persea americana TaxID=3435 RepID=A0ACC2LHN1_PERAE|nr:hypothetical protein MRB53_026255 [Persea americana]
MVQILFGYHKKHIQGEAAALSPHSVSSPLSLSGSRPLSLSSFLCEGFRGWSNERGKVQPKNSNLGI